MNLRILVMNPDYGSRLQLQKNRDVRCADLVVVNKGDLQGARTPARKSSGGSVPTGAASASFPPTATHHHDPGVGPSLCNALGEVGVCMNDWLSNRNPRITPFPARYGRMHRLDRRAKFSGSQQPARDEERRPGLLYIIAAGRKPSSGRRMSRAKLSPIRPSTPTILPANGSR